MRFFLKIRVLIVAIAFFTGVTMADSWVRYNQAGYTSDRDISVVVMSDLDLKDQNWSLVDESLAEIKKGVFLESEYGIGADTPKEFNYTIDLGVVPLGQYKLLVPGADTANIVIKVDPYSKLITQALRHLRVERSGTTETLLRSGSHFGDSAAIVYNIKGDASLGAWEAAIPKREVDMLGGWYDAGDYIKFTLTIAQTTYLLLRAYEENPAVFTTVYSNNSLKDVLDESKIGLDYLAKTLVDENTFVIQVSSGLDHSAGHRLPESDTRDGSREALVAISRPHMGSTAAALALGSRIFAEVGENELADLYKNKAEAIFARAQKSDALNAGAFEKDAANDFYNDRTDKDNMKLAASELFKLTNDSSYKTVAEELVCGAGVEVSWAIWNFMANWSFSDDADTYALALSEVDKYVNNGSTNIWNTPSSYVWAALHRWTGAANAARQVYEKSKDVRHLNLFNDMLDYSMGKNNWGVGFLASPDLENSVQNIYSQIYDLLDVFPKGAYSEGPADRLTHESMEGYFSISPDDPMHEFNTTAAVFYDNKKDFVTQESTTIGQAEIILMLAMASAKDVEVAADSGAADIEGPGVDISKRYSQDLSVINVYGYDDHGEGGESSFEILTKSADEISANLNSVTNSDLGYQYAGLGISFVKTGIDMKEIDGVALTMNIPVGKSVRVSFPQTSINDNNYYGKTIIGKGEAEYIFIWSEMERGWASTPVVNMIHEDISELNIISEAPDQSVSVSITKIDLWSDSETNISAIKNSNPIQEANGVFLNQLDNNNIRILLENNRGADITIRKISGEVVMKTNIPKRQLSAVVDTTSFSNGVYFIEVKQMNFSENIKYIKV